MATSDQPLSFDLNSADGRWELGFSDRQSEQLASWQFVSLRVHTGEDASCLSLYRPKQPRVLGVPGGENSLGTFAWAATSGQSLDPWHALRQDLGSDEAGRPVIPVVLDLNTAMYSLQLYGGIGSRLSIRSGNGQPITLQVAGLLKNSVLQGDLLVSEESFLQLFPDENGHRFFLARPTAKGPENSEVAVQTSKLLESVLSDYGFDAVDANERLAGFLAVQNTYLWTFQSLGVLGLLLGTAGLAVVQLRSVLERRAELALMQAGGFRRRGLVRLVLYENGLLLGGGLTIGVFAAAVALIPHWLPHDARVPWTTVIALLATIGLVGTFAAWLATSRALAAPIVPALRGN